MTVMFVEMTVKFVEMTVKSVEMTAGAGYARRRNTHGRFPITRPSFFHSAAFFVLIYASGIVMLAATQILVDALHVASMSAKSESFLYGVSMMI